MVEPMLIDLKALLVEHEDCDAGTVQQAAQRPGPGRYAVSQPPRRHRLDAKKTGSVYRRGSQALAPQARHRLVLPRLHGRSRRASAAGRRQLGQLLPGPRPRLAPGLRRGRQGFREGREARLHAKPGAVAARRHLPPEGRPRPGARVAWPSSKNRAATTPSITSSSPAAILPKANASRPSSTSRRAVELDPGHTSALFQLAHANDLAGNDDEAITSTSAA